MSHALERTRYNVRTIHPCALLQFDEDGCITALGVARDLRSGVIELFDMKNDRHCILGHTARRLGRGIVRWPIEIGERRSSLGLPAQVPLFSGSNPSDPQLAADAIERFIYEGAEQPWAIA